MTSETPAPRSASILLRLATLGAILLAAGMILASALVLRSCSIATSDRFENIFTMKSTSRTVLDGTVDSLRKRAKLVVQQADITAEVSRAETYHWWKIYFGTTSAKVRARGCKVQYAIPLHDFSLSNLEAVETSDGRSILRILLPPPAVDEDIVEVNYGQLEVEAASAWARFNKNDVAEEAKKLLRQSAVDKARNPSNIELAQLNAEAALRKLLEPLTAALRPEVNLEIRFLPPERR